MQLRQRDTASLLLVSGFLRNSAPGVEWAPRCPVSGSAGCARPHRAVGEPIPIFRNRGNVILVRAGNPKGIRSLWDLGRDDVRVETSNPETEGFSFDNDVMSLYHLARGKRTPSSRRLSAGPDATVDEERARIPAPYRPAPYSPAPYLPNTRPRRKPDAVPRPSCTNSP